MALQACLMDTFSCSKVVGQQVPTKTGPVSHWWQTTSQWIWHYGQELEYELIASKQLLSYRKQKMLQDLIDSSSDMIDRRKHRSNSSCLYSSPDHSALWNFNAGFCAAGIVSFVGLPPNLWYLVSNCPVLLLLAPNQPLRAVLRIQKRLHLWYTVSLILR